MTREEKIVTTFVEFADAMVDDFDVVDFMHRLVQRSMELLDCAEVGLLLANAEGTLQVMASSSERSEALELLQSQNEEGPCFECYRTAQQVSSADLASERERWPAFAPAAVAYGIRSVHAIPMRVREQTIGALNLFRSEVGHLAERDVPLGQGIADVAAVALLQERALRETRGVVAQLQGALNSRVLIEQAKGVLAERAHISVDEAFASVRGYARAHNRRLSDVARDVVDGRLSASDLAELAQHTSELAQHTSELAQHTSS
jgi:transcriptional regulator with GAF, ATPase, and Fis domain